MKSATPSEVKRQLRAIDAAAVVACVVLTAAVFFAGLRPLMRQREVRVQQRQQLVAHREEVAQVTTTLGAMRQQMITAEQKIAHNTLRLEPLDALNQRVAHITELAGRCGLRIERIRPGTSVAGEHYHTIPIAVAGSGSFQDSTAFIHTLHQTLPDVAVRSLGLEGRPGGAAPPTFRFELTWYAAPPPDGR